MSIAESHTPGVPGGVASAVKEWNATVMSVDTESRQFVVQDDAGNQKTLTAPAEMVNFSQLRVGDKVHALLTLETAVFMTDGTAEDSSMNIVVAPSVGEKPGLHAVDETETTAIVEALDIPNRLATLKFADGSTQVVVVRDDVQLSEAQIGAQLKIVMSTSLTIDVQSPVAR